MGTCGMSFTPPSAGLLIQIRHGYAADCSGLQLSIESDAEGWRAKVRGENGQELYSARRCNPWTAKVAAAEFAVFGTHQFPDRSPEGLARQLSWNEYW